MRPSWPHIPLNNVWVLIWVDLARVPEKLVSTTHQATISDVFPKSVALERLQNEKKSFAIYRGMNKNRRGWIIIDHVHHLSLSPKCNFFL
jgi:stage III sporulation protein SpoIIIAA